MLESHRHDPDVVGLYMLPPVLKALPDFRVDVIKWPVWEVGRWGYTDVSEKHRGDGNHNDNVDSFNFRGERLQAC